MNQRTPYSEWMFCFLAGGLAGAGVALLLAPRSGNATRRMMGRTRRDAADGAREFKDGLVAQSEEIQNEAGRLGDEATPR